MTIKCSHTHIVVDRDSNVKAIAKSLEEGNEFIRVSWNERVEGAQDWRTLPIQVRPAEWTPDQIIPREELLRNQEQAALWRSLVAGLHRHGYDQVMDKGVNGIVKLIEAAARTVTGQGKVPGDNPLKRATDIDALRDKFAAEAPIDYTMARRAADTTFPLTGEAFMLEWARMRYKWADQMMKARSEEGAQ